MNRLVRMLAEDNVAAKTQRFRSTEGISALGEFPFVSNSTVVIVKILLHLVLITVPRKSSTLAMLFIERKL